jgi:hypothetical protein
MIRKFAARRKSACVLQWLCGPHNGTDFSLSRQPPITYLDNLFPQANKARTLEMPPDLTQSERHETHRDARADARTTLQRPKFGPSGFTIWRTCQQERSLALRRWLRKNWPGRALW